MSRDKIKKTFSIIFLTIGFLFLTLLPVGMIWGQGSVSSQTPQGPNISGISYDCAQTQDANGNYVSGNCTFVDVIAAVQNVVKVAVSIALAFSVIVIVRAGWIYLTSGGEPAKRQEANKMFVKVLWGIFWILGAWLVINLIMTALPISDKIPQFLK